VRDDWALGAGFRACLPWGTAPRIERALPH